MVPLVLRRHVPSAYRPVLANRVFRRLILGFAVSYLCDGMSFVAVAWLAVALAPGAVQPVTARRQHRARRVSGRRTARLARRAAYAAAVRHAARGLVAAA